MTAKQPCACYRTRFPFEPREEPCAELCLCVKRQVRVRLLQPLHDEGDDEDEEWCVAQREDGEVGLLPRFLLEPAPLETFRLRGQSSAACERATADEDDAHGVAAKEGTRPPQLVHRLGELEAECDWLRQTAATLRHELAEKEEGSDNDDDEEEDEVSISSSDDDDDDEAQRRVQEEVALVKSRDVPAVAALRAELERYTALNEQRQMPAEDEQDEALAACAVREAKLRAREAKADTLLAEWQAESDALAVSEAALADYLQPSPPQTKSKSSNVQRQEGEDEEVTVELRDGVDWPPRSLAGLTPQEAHELSAAVRAYDKYTARLQALGEERQQAGRRVEQMHEALRRGDAEVAKMTAEMRAAEDYIAVNAPLLAEMQTQLDIAHRLLHER